MDNPYHNHPNLSVLESQVLWEYAQLAHHLKTITRLLTQQPDSALLANLRTLEKKMGLVLTLVRAITRSFTHLLRITQVQSLRLGCHQRTTRCVIYTV